MLNARFIQSLHLISEGRKDSFWEEFWSTASRDVRLEAIKAIEVMAVHLHDVGKAEKGMLILVEATHKLSEVEIGELYLHMHYTSWFNARWYLLSKVNINTLYALKFSIAVRNACRGVSYGVVTAAALWLLATLI